MVNSVNLRIVYMIMVLLITTMDMKKQLGKKLKEWRKRRNFTQEDLAGVADLSVDAISMIERGINFPTPATVEKLSKALGIAKHEFYVSEGDKEAKDTRQELINSITGLVYGMDEKTLKIVLKQIEALVG